jgi:hypothetical protein
VIPEESSLFCTTTLHRGLRHSLRQALEESSDSLFSLSYDEYLELVQRYERRQRRPPKATPPSQSVQLYQKPTSQPTAHSTSEPMDLDPIRVRSARVSPPSPCLSDIRHAHRRQENLCFYCGSPDHRIADCYARSRSRSRSRTPERPVRVKTTAVRRGEPYIPPDSKYPRGPLVRYALDYPSKPIPTTPASDSDDDPLGAAYMDSCSWKGDP